MVRYLIDKIDICWLRKVANFQAGKKLSGGENIAILVGIAISSKRYFKNYRDWGDLVLLACGQDYLGGLAFGG